MAFLAGTTATGKSSKRTLGSSEIDPKPGTKLVIQITGKAPNTFSAQGGPIQACIEDIRQLALSSRALHNKLRDTRRRVTAMVGSGRRDLVSVWDAYPENYKALLDDAVSAASQLSAHIKVYLVLQEQKDKVKEGNMITELSALKTNIERTNFGLSAACAKLMDDIANSSRGLSEHINAEARRLQPEGDRAAQMHAQQVKSNVNGGVPVLAADRLSANPSINPAAMKLSTFIGRLFLSRTRARQAEESSTTVTTKPTNRDRSSGARNKRKQDQAQAGTGSTAAARARADTGIMSALMQPGEAVKVTETMGAIAEIIKELESQIPKFDAFSQLSQHLKNELNAYLLAFQGAQAYPTPVRLTSLLIHLLLLTSVALVGEETSAPEYALSCDVLVIELEGMSQSP
ncbi:hypothetical protein BN946_scf184862.g2 [Trametes cinnabarina]|uniref:Uncharacterized protein n=1 Tax=Pycnoporus cinnabarinus TaxID=5643 RepID=A0A060SJL4_PYCCI|nr:hypothetical protein BN946_scf184862.g2 [Trametes cinnabarina]